MAKKLEVYNDIITIKMDVNQLPTYKIDTAGEFVKWGKDNNFPKELLNSYNNHPEHAAILKGKARYLSGLKIVPSQDLPQVQQFLAKANRFDSWYELRKKCDSDKAIYGGFACQVTTNLIGQPIEFYHLDMGKIRLSADNCGVWYSEDWTAKSYHLKKTYFPFYKDGFIGASIYYSKDFIPSLNELDGLYPSPDYSSVLLDINTDIEISNFFHSLVKNGFSAGHIITFFSGKLTPEVKEDIKERFQEKHQGTQNAGKVVLSFTNPDGKGAEVVNVTPTGLADQYEALNKRNQQKIITGHNVPGVLFKIKTEGTLGDRNELDLAHELFINEYAKIEQVAFNKFIDKMFKLKTGLDIKFEVEQVQPIGKELPLENQN
ncbi:MAG: phage portal protein, partial [Sphingobacteriia bacterium]|nr:phage portal protein [Candidatus Fonsibacter lacus]